MKIDGREAINSKSRGFTLATITSDGNLGEIKAAAPLSANETLGLAGELRGAKSSPDTNCRK